MLALASGALPGCGSHCNNGSYADAIGHLAVAAAVCQFGSCVDEGLSIPILGGRVLEPAAYAARPVGYVRLTLQQSGHEIATATTDRAGRFAFTQDIPDGIYDLVLDGDRHVGASRVVLEGRAVSVDVVAVAR